MTVARARVPRASRQLFRELIAGRPRGRATLASVLAGELADVQSAVLHRMMAKEPSLREKALCLAVHDPGLWCGETVADRSYLSLCDSARLAELSGLNVLDALPARDLAQGGQGGPLLAGAYWLLLHHVDRPRAIVHLESTTRITYLPASRDAAGVSRVMACDVGPGTRLLGSVATQVSDPGRAVSPGHLAVQGCLRADLLAAWSANPAVASASEVWHPHGIPQKDLAAEIVKAVTCGAVSAADAMCTITHLIVTAIAGRLTHGIPGTPPLAEIVFIGPNRRDGLLLQQCGRQLPGVAFLSEADAGLSPGGLEPAAVAIMAQLYLEQVPGNPTAVTGVQVPRVLGRLTPGSPQNWLRLVREMAKHQPVVTLRTAI